MKVNHARIVVPRIVICVVVWVIGMRPAAVGAAPARFVAFSLDEHGAIVVPVFIDGAGPFSFLLDTGSSRSAIGDDLAARLAAPAVARTLVVTAAGTAMRPVVRLGSVSLGSAASMSATLDATPPSPPWVSYRSRTRPTDSADAPRSSSEQRDEVTGQWHEHPERVSLQESMSAQPMLAPVRAGTVGP